MHRGFLQAHRINIIISLFGIVLLGFIWLGLYHLLTILAQHIPLYYVIGGLVSVVVLVFTVVLQTVLSKQQKIEAELRESEEKYRTLFELESIALFLIDSATGIILDANKAASILYGYSRDELLQMRNVDLSAEPEATKKAGQSAGSGQVVNIPVRYHRKKDGTRFPVEIHATALMWKGRLAHIPAIYDISSRLKSDFAIQRKAQIQSVLKEIGEVALVSKSVDELYSKVHALIGKVLPAKLFHFNLLDEATGQIVVPYNADDISTIPRRRPVGKGLTEYIMRLGHAVHITPEEQKRLSDAGEYLLGDVQNVQRRHYLGAPLIDSKGKAFGIISLILVGEEETFETEDAEILSIIAGQVAMAIERKRAEEELRKRESFQEALLANMDAGVLVIDAKTQIIEKINLAAARMFGRSEKEVIGRKCLEFLCPAIEGRCPTYDLGQDMDYSERELIKTDETRIPILKSVKRITIGEQEKLIEVFVSIAERKLMETELYQLATTDKLTGTFNRSYFLERSEEVLKNAKRHGRKFTVMMLDIDCFKSINDNFGHAVGDEALQRVSEICRESLREIDLLGRLGGDEFAIVLNEVTLSAAMLIAERLRLAIHESEFVTEQGIRAPLSVSIGVAEYPLDLEDFSDLMKRADIALYRAKNSGRNRAVACE